MLVLKRDHVPHAFDRRPTRGAIPPGEMETARSGADVLVDGPHGVTGTLVAALGTFSAAEGVESFAPAGRVAGDLGSRCGFWIARSVCVGVEDGWEVGGCSNGVA